MTQLADAPDAQASFKDYCLILQVHPEADAGMIEAAYWHLARRYNEQSDTDPLAKQALEDLNEAYSVMGSPSRREEYSRLRNEVLGEGALPAFAAPIPEAPPLAVMERAKPRSRDLPAQPGRRFDLSLDFRLESFVMPSWPNSLMVLAGLLVTIGLMVASAGQLLVVLALAAAAVVSAAPILRLIATSRAVQSLLHDPEPTSHLRHLGPRPRR